MSDRAIDDGFAGCFDKNVQKERMCDALAVSESNVGESRQTTEE